MCCILSPLETFLEIYKRACADKALYIPMRKLLNLQYRGL